MSLPHKCRCAICGGEMGWIGMPSVTQMYPCTCVGANCCLENQAPNTGIALGGAYCRKARGEFPFASTIATQASGGTVDAT